ncbi:MAG: DUF4230 domain-containing protein [Tissierellaceae bacterium]
MDFKKIKRYLIIGLIILGLIAITVIFFKIRQKKNNTVISKTIEEKVSRIVELSTIKYNYTDVLSYKDSKQISGLNIPLTEKSFIVQYSGYLKAGIDMKSIEVHRKDKDTIHITMDKAEVLENVIEEEKVKFFDERDGLFNKLNFTELYDVLVGEKEKMKLDAIDKGLLIEAQNNAEEILLSLLEAMDFNNIVIRFR